MKLKGIKKYYLGIAVLGVFTLVILVFVLLMASATKQDTNTYNKANDIADKLNAYVENNQMVPASLEQAGVNDAPSTITYTKNSDSSYTFCATYREASSNFSSDGIDALTGSSLQQQSTDITTLPNQPYIDNSSLYIDPTHHKGQNCQTVQTYISTPYCGYYSNSNTVCPVNLNGGAVSQ